MVNFIKYRLFLIKENIDALRRINSFKKLKTIYLFGVPIHPNIGDQAQTLCILDWLKNNYPEYKIELFNYYQVSKIILSTLRRNIKDEDKILFHSGYHLTDIWPVQDGYCRIIDLFHDHEIVIFPQTINYLDKKNLIKTAYCINSHPQLTLLCRDEVSFKTAKEYFTHTRLYLYPDIVTSLIGTRKYDGNRNGILLCIRNDKEKYYSQEQIETLIKRYKGIEDTHISDTTLNISSREMVSNREGIINSEIERYSKYKLIITDRYHGVILSLIAGTPVIVISSSDHKLISGVDWFPEGYRNYVAYAKDLDEVYILSIKFLNAERKNLLSPYFKEKYYDVLKQKLERKDGHLR